VTVRVALADYCQGRSGDKADRANVGIFAPSREFYEVLREQLTAARVAEHLALLVEGPVVRYEVPDLLALNFVCDRALGGGSERGLRIDPLAKTFASNVLRMTVDLPEELVGRDLRPRPPDA
jgi:hypothetical protein